MDIEEVGREIVDSAVKVHRELGPGLLESAYQHCLEFEVVVENKSVDQLQPVHAAQILTYLKLGGFQLGYLINWNVKLVKNGIKRMVLNLPEPHWRSEHKR